LDYNVKITANAQDGYTNGLSRMGAMPECYQRYTPKLTNVS